MPEIKTVRPNMGIVRTRESAPNKIPTKFAMIK
jgi:hypothetical protein